MEKKLVNGLLVIVFALVYFIIFNFIWNHFLHIESSFSVLIGSILVIFTSFLLALLTTNKMIDIIRS